MGAVYIAMGDFENAVLSHEQHLKIAKQLGNKREEARAYSNLGSAYHYRRSFDKAMSYHNHVLALARELEEEAFQMRAYAGLGHAARCLQDLDRAKQYHQEQLHIAEGLRDRAAEGRASSNLGQWDAGAPGAQGRLMPVGVGVRAREGGRAVLCEQAGRLGPGPPGETLREPPAGTEAPAQGEVWDVLSAPWAGTATSFLWMRGWGGAGRGGGIASSRLAPTEAGGVLVPCWIEGEGVAHCSKRGK